MFFSDLNETSKINPYEGSVKNQRNMFGSTFANHLLSGWLLFRRHHPTSPAPLLSSKIKQLSLGSRGCFRVPTENQRMNGKKTQNPIPLSVICFWLILYVCLKKYICQCWNFTATFFGGKCIPWHQNRSECRLTKWNSSRIFQMYGRSLADIE